MNGRFLLLILGTSLALGTGKRAGAQSLAIAPSVSTATSDLYPEVTCTSTHPQLNTDILQLANDARDRLGSLLKLGNEWRFPVNIRVVMPDDPLAGKITEEGVAVTATGKSMSLEAVLPSDDPDARAFIQRQFVTALLWERFFANTHTFDRSTKLTVVPLWLIEGLNEWLDDDSGRDREAIVRRAVAIHRAPSLSDIMGWEDISQDRLLGLYQRAFCYYLVDSLIQGEVRRADFLRWLGALTGPNPASARALFPRETAWQGQLKDAPELSHDIVYTWDDSATALSDAEPIAILGKKPDDTQITTLDTVLSAPPSADLTKALNKKIFDLTQLELRAHPSWRPILALYRFGLTALVEGRRQDAVKFIHEAQKTRTDEVAYHQKLADYVNWFEVTKDYSGHTSQFNSYFFTAQAMEKMEADPDHPNPIRADLIHIESQL